MPLFGSVSRELYEEVKSQRDQARADLAAERERYQALVSTVIDIKRNEHGLPPDGFDPAENDPMNMLGPKTQLAIEEFSAGDAELRSHLIKRAMAETAALMGEHAGKRPDAETDQEVANRVEQGDPG